MRVRDTRIVAKVVLVTENGDILLLRRSKSDVRRPLQWDLPGGAVDEGEPYDVAAARETHEEAGIVIAPHDLMLGFTMADNTDKGNVCWLFYVACIPGELLVTLSHEHTEFAWVPLSDACSYILYERQQRALKHIQRYVLEQPK